MGFLDSLTGKSQAKAASRASKMVQAAELENKARGISTEQSGLEDLDASLANALAELETGSTKATGALQPYADAGNSALSLQADLQGLNGPERQAEARLKFQADPGYQFRLSEGVRALDNSATARGNLYSGHAMKAMNDYGQQSGSAEYGNWYGRLSELAGRGQDAAGNISSTLSKFAQDKANALLGTGQNKASMRLSMHPIIAGHNTAATTARATGIKQAADARATGAGNLLSTAVNVGKMALGAF